MVNRKNIEILIISQFFEPEFGAASSRITGLSKHLVKIGCNVSVITGYPSYPLGIVYNTHIGNNTPENIYGITVYRVWSFINPGKSNILRIINFISFMISSIIRGLRIAKHCDVIFVSSPPLIIGLSGWFLSKLFRKKFVFDIRDIWPSVAIEAGEFKENSVLVIIAKTIASFIYKHANHLTPVTEKKRSKLIQAGINEEKITTIHNGIDPEIISSVNAINIHAKLNIRSGKIICVYAGLIGIAQGVHKIVQLAEGVKNDSQFHFLIIGDGVEKETIEKDIIDRGLINISLFPKMGKEEVIGYLKASHIAIIPLVSSKVDDAIPSKLLEAWGCSLPVMLIAQGEAKFLVDSVGGGRCAPPEDFAAIKDQFLKFRIKNDYHLCGQNGYDFVTNNLTRHQSTKKLLNLFYSL